MIDRARSKYAAFDYDTGELVRVQQEVAEKYGKDYCVIATAEAMHIMAMMATEDHLATTGQHNPKRTKVVAKFVGVAIKAALKNAGFAKEECVAICTEIVRIAYD